MTLTLLPDPGFFPRVSNGFEHLFDVDLPEIDLGVDPRVEGEEESAFVALYLTDADDFPDLVGRQIVKFVGIQAEADSFPAGALEEVAWPSEGPGGNSFSISALMRSIAAFSATSASSAVMPVIENMIACWIGA